MKRNLVIIALSFVLIVGTLLLGNVIVIGEKLGEVTHVYVEYAFYALLLLFAFVYLVIPMIKVHNAPELPALSENVKRNEEQLLAFARNLAKHCDYIQDVDKRKIHRQQLAKSIKENASNPMELRKLVAEEVALRMNGNKELQVLGINKRIKEWGKTVLMVTAVSQNSKFDTLSVLVMNYRMIADIVMASGFRPTRPQLFKLYMRVLTTALVTYCASQVFGDMEDWSPFNGLDAADASDALDAADAADAAGGMGDAIMGGLQSLKIPAPLVGSTMDGAVNALMTLRIGYVTRAYLTEGSQALAGVNNKRRVKRQAMKDALMAMPAVIAHGGVAVGKTAFGLLKKAFA